MTRSRVLTALFFPSVIIAMYINHGVRATNQRVSIVEAPTDQFSTDGFLEFSCKAKGDPTPTINWHDAETGKKVLDQVPSVKSPSGFHVNPNHGTLMISNPIKYKTYSFYCNASQANDFALSETVTGGLAFLEKTFRHSPINASVNEGDDTFLDCIPPSGLPEAHVSWRWKSTDDEVSMLRSNMHVLQNGTLYIEGTTVSEAGIYTCIANNTFFTRQTSDVLLRVNSFVHFVESPKNIRVLLGQNATFNCQVDVNRKVIWTRLDKNKAIDHIRSKITNRFLRIVNVTLEDSGVYVCSIAGSQPQAARLVVDSPPEFVTKPTDHTAFEGETVTLRCTVTGHPVPSIYWELPDKTPIFPSETDIRSNDLYYLHKDGRLELLKVKPEASGRYMCTAHSSVGTIYSSAFLTVLPRSSTRPGGKGKEVVHTNSSNAPISMTTLINPVILLPPENTSSREGVSVILDCVVRPRTNGLSHLNDSLRASKHCNQTVSWQIGLNDGRTVWLTEGAHSNRYPQYSIRESGSLKITNAFVNASGNYTCIAKCLPIFTELHNQNQPDVQSNWSANLIVHSHQNAPSTFDSTPTPPPQNLQVLQIRETSVTLVWEFPPPSDLHKLVDQFEVTRNIAYWIEFFSLSSHQDGWIVVEENWPSTTIQLRGLQANSGYYFLVRSRLNEGRVGWASEPIGPVWTRKISPPKQVQAPQRRPLINTLQYRYRAQNVRIQNLKLQTTSFSSIRVTWRLSEFPDILLLIKGYTVHFMKAPLVTCISELDYWNENENEAVPPACCSLQVKEMHGKKEIFKSLENLDRLRLESDSQQQRRVSYAKLDVPSRYDRKFYTRRSESRIMYEGAITLRNLVPFNCYMVYVSAYVKSDRLGKLYGPKGRVAYAITGDRAPSAPPDSLITQWIGKNREQIQLKWNAPPVSHWNGLITGYTVYVFDGKARQQHMILNVSQSSLTLPMFIHPDYMAQVAASNCAGLSDACKPIYLQPVNSTPNAIPVEWAERSPPVEHYHRNRLKWLNEPWFIVAVSVTLVTWCAIIIIIVLLCAKRHATQVKGRENILIVHGTGTPKRPNTNIEFERHRSNLEPLLKSENGLSDQETMSNKASISTGCKSYVEFIPLSMKQERLTTNYNSGSIDMHDTLPENSTHTPSSTSVSNMIHSSVERVHHHPCASPNESITDYQQVAQQNFLPMQVIDALSWNTEMTRHQEQIFNKMASNHSNNSVAYINDNHFRSSSQAQQSRCSDFHSVTPYATSSILLNSRIGKKRSDKKHDHLESNDTTISTLGSFENWGCNGSQRFCPKNFVVSYPVNHVTTNQVQHDELENNHVERIPDGQSFMDASEHNEHRFLKDANKCFKSSYSKSTDHGQFKNPVLASNSSNDSDYMAPSETSIKHNRNQRKHAKYKNNDIPNRSQNNNSLCNIGINNNNNNNDKQHFNQGQNTEPAHVQFCVPVSQPCSRGSMTPASIQHTNCFMQT